MVARLKSMVTNTQVSSSAIPGTKPTTSRELASHIVPLILRRIGRMDMGFINSKELSMTRIRTPRYTMVDCRTRPHQEMAMRDERGLIGRCATCDCGYKLYFPI